MRIAIGQIAVTNPPPGFSNVSFSSALPPVTVNSMASAPVITPVTVSAVDYATIQKQAKEVLSGSKIDRSQCPGFISTMLAGGAGADNNFKAALCLAAYPDSDSCAKYDVFLQRQLGDAKYTWEAGYGNPGIAAGCASLSGGVNWKIILGVAGGIFLLWMVLR